MIKFGIYNIKKLKKIKNFSKNRKRISILLYKISNQKQKLSKYKDHILLNFADSNGIYKRTYEGRFGNFDRGIINYLTNQNFKKKVDVHDAAISDGRSSIDFFNQLNFSLNINKFHCSDFYENIYYLRISKYIIIVFGENNQLYELNFYNFVFNFIKKESFLYYPINRFLLFFLNLYFKNNLIYYKKKNKYKIFKLKLIDKQIFEYQKNYNYFKFSKKNIFDKFQLKYDIFRVMNLINLNYFKEKKIIEIIKNIHKSMNDKGYLIVGSNQIPNSEVDGGIYMKTSNKFILIKEFGDYKLINEIILKFKRGKY